MCNINIWLSNKFHISAHFSHFIRFSRSSNCYVSSFRKEPVCTYMLTRKIPFFFFNVAFCSHDASQFLQLKIQISCYWKPYYLSLQWKYFSNMRIPNIFARFVFTPFFQSNTKLSIFWKSSRDSHGGGFCCGVYDAMCICKYVEHSNRFSTTLEWFCRKQTQPHQHPKSWKRALIL